MAAARRVARELAHIKADGISSTVHIAPRGGDLTTLDALIIGPEDTPYDGAVLHFRIKVPPEYPIKPPEVKFMNTDGGSLRLHPQLYSDGKVCLSILGTWHGPGWSPLCSLGSVLLSIQSLLNEAPLRCEPGLEQAPADAVERANAFVSHEVARVAIIRELVGPPSWGSNEDCAHFLATMHSHLGARREPLLDKLSALARRHDGQVMRDPFTFSAPSAGRRFQFAGLAARMAELLPAAKDRSVSPSSSRGGSAGAATGSSGACNEARNRGGRAVATDEGREEPACCRICHLSEEESGVPLLAPCRCSGSIRNAHSRCLLDWMRHPSAAASSSSWRCDICKSKYRVELGRGRVPGAAMLCRSLDAVSEREFEAPGLVAVLLISVLQSLLTTIGRVLAQGLLRFVAILCAVLPPPAGPTALVVLSVPSMAIELATSAVYAGFFAAKVAISWTGAGWRPSCWGALGEDFIGSVLYVVADCLSFACILQLRGLMAVCFSLTVTQGVSWVSGHSVLIDVVHTVVGPASAQGLSASDSGLRYHFAALGSTLSEGGLAPFAVAHSCTAFASFLLNATALARLLKMAFVDEAPEPVNVLPWVE